MVTYILAAIVAAGAFLVVLGVGQARRAAGGAEDFSDRVASYGGDAGLALASVRPTPQGLRESLNRLFQPAADRLGQREQKRGKPSLAEQLAKADLKLRTSEFVMIQFGLVILLVLLALVRFGFPGGIIPMLVAGVIGYFAPGFYVSFRQKRRLRAFNGQLGDTLTLLSNALKAGYSFAQAIDTVAKNGTAPIADEFARAVREMNLGGSVEEALNNMVKRVASDDLDLVVTAVSIHRTVGGNLAEILDNIAHTIRERIRIKGEIRTLTAQARASGWIITLLPIGLAVLLFVIAPNYFGPMTKNFIGYIMLGVAALMILIGNAIIRKIVAIEV
ncbi:MAG TPA: type II secretion system F family protein [Candidatus Dormibacteraeota bacterium]